VLLAFFVVEKDAALHGLGGESFGDEVFTASFGQPGGDVEGVESVAGVTTGVGGDGGEGFVFRFDSGGAEAPCGVGERPVEEARDLLFREGDKGVNAAAGEERGIDFEGRVLRGCADEADGAALDVGEEGVLLSLVEAVDLVDEEDGAGAEASGLFGLDHHLLDLFDPAENGGELDEACLGRLGDDLGECGFAYARRTPEDHGGWVVGRNGEAKRFAFGEEMLLAGELGEGQGPHAFGEGRAVAGRRAGGERRGVEQAHARTPTRARWRWAS